MEWYERHPSEYKEDTWHLSLAEHGAYNLLIDHYYSNEAALPDSDRALASICNCTSEEWLEVKNNVLRFFTKKNGKLRHKKCDAIISVSYRKRKDGAKRAAKFRKNKKSVTHDVTVTSRSTGQDRTGQERKKSKPKENPEFDRWYSFYPRKIAPGKAQQSYEAVITKKLATHEDLFEALKRYCEDIERNATPSKFIKHPATYLNQACFNDDYAEIKHLDVFGNDRTSGHEQKAEGIVALGRKYQNQ